MKQDMRMKPRVKCLLVDDLGENLLALSKLVERDDVEVLSAHSGVEALEILLAHEVALALIDVQMPGMDGFELAELMRGSERTRAIPIIFVTAGIGDQSRVFKGYEAGAVDFLYKPIEPRVLRNKVDVFFELNRQRQQLSRDLVERTETLRLHEMFTAVLGHDLRNPLSGIMMMAESIQRRATDEAAKRNAERILSSGKWMSRLISDMLDVARARLGGGIVLSRQRADLNVVVQQALQDLSAAFPDRQVETVCTGVGSAKDNPAWSGYPVKLTFNNTAGENEANEHISITMGGKPVMDTDCDAPWLLIKAPAGHYDVHASLADNRTASAAFSTNGNGAQQTVNLAFPAAKPQSSFPAGQAPAQSTPAQ